MQDQSFDVVVVGGGLVGSSLVAALDGSGLRVAQVDPAPAPAPAAADAADWDQRIYAISPGSERFLASLQAWPAENARIAQVAGMQVFGDAAGGHIAFDAREAGAPWLASIVENRLLMQALEQRLARMSELQVLRSPAIELETEDDCMRLRLQDGTQLEVRLVVGADGAESWVRTGAGIQPHARPYGQTAVVANFACTHPHRDVARQWFRADGILALLPLPGRRCSMVWSAEAGLADELMALPVDQLALRVAAAAGHALGEMRTITAPACFALQLVRVERLVQPRIALVGDAAHRLHPLAGQGVNLGFQDAQELARVLRERGACGDVGEYRLLRRYERARREDILAMTVATDGLQRLFGQSGSPLRWLRNRGMTLVGRALPLKRLLVRQALG